MSNQYKIAITVDQSRGQVFVEDIPLELHLTAADAEHRADIYGRFPSDILQRMNEMLKEAVTAAEIVRTERFSDDREWHLARQYQYIADIANAAVRVSLLMRNVK